MNLNQREFTFTVTTQDYVSRKEIIIRYERTLLRTFGFVLFMEHPHKFVTPFLFQLGVEKDLRMMQLTWSVLNDRYERVGKRKDKTGCFVGNWGDVRCGSEFW